MGRVIVPVSTEVLHHFLATGVKPAMEIRDGLPPDAEFVGAAHDFARNEFVLCYQHKSFPASLPGDRLPRLVPTVWKVEADAPHIITGGAT